MSDNKFPDISVGNFAMDILKDMAKNPSESLKPALKESTTQSLNAPDISKIKVSNDYVSMVLGEKKQAPRKVQKIQESTEDRLENLIGRLSSLMTEAKQLLSEMSPGTTTVGNVGTNTLGKAKKNSKLNSCINRLKRKYG
jgi:hypothetical protein